MKDLIVIGAGPCGLAVGVAAREQGVDCTIIEKGCITRAIALYPTYGTFFSTADKLELGGVPFITLNEKPTRVEALRYYRRIVDHFELDVRQYEEVVAVEGEPGDFIVRTRRTVGAGPRPESRLEPVGGTETVHRTRRVVVATGYFDTPNRLNVPGEDLPHVSHWYREGAPFFQQRVVVVGGGNSAVEAALDLHRNGASVALVHFETDLDDGIKPWILPEIASRIDKGVIDTHWCCRLTRIEPGSVTLENHETGEESRLETDFVFAMIGWTPNPLLLREIGVSIDPDTHIPAHDPDTYETDVPGVHIAGVLVSGSNKTFIENGREHGAKIVAAVKRELARSRERVQRRVG